MDSQLHRAVLTDPLVPGDVGYVALTPPGWAPAERLPLIQVLHGADSSGEVLAFLRPVVDALWADGSLPRAVLASASTPTVGGFYVDRAGARWETLVAEAFPRLVAREYGTDPARVALLGSSMGGYGALKIAFADPARWRAVAAIAPALLPAATPADLRPRNTLGVLADLGREMAGDGTDARRYAANRVVDRLRTNADAVRDSGLPIFLRCGDRDVFAMHDGAEQLHRALWEEDIGHEYHLVLGADHVGPEAVAAQRAALTFVGTALRGDASGAADRELAAAWERWANGGRAGAPPEFDATGSTAPLALRLMLAPALADREHRDPTARRRYGRVD
ncbi:MAG TPA: alpha/beta hydrolase-fold protein [Actinocatenispora sp.]